MNDAIRPAAPETAATPAGLFPGQGDGPGTTGRPGASACPACGSTHVVADWWGYATCLPCGWLGHATELKAAPAFKDQGAGI